MPFPGAVISSADCSCRGQPPKGGEKPPNTPKISEKDGRVGGGDSQLERRWCVYGARASQFARAMQFKVKVSKNLNHSEFILNAENEADARRQLRRKGYSANTAIIEQLKEGSELSGKSNSSKSMIKVGLVGTGLLLLASTTVIGLIAEPFDPEVCRTETGRLQNIQQCMSILNENEYAWTHRDLSPDICKQYIGSIMGRDPNMMRTISSDSSIVRIDYRRNDDNKKFTYECTTLGDDVIWRGIDIFRTGDGPGRWRKEDAKSITAFK